MNVSTLHSQVNANKFNASNNYFSQIDLISDAKTKLCKYHVGRGGVYETQTSPRLFRNFAVVHYVYLYISDYQAFSELILRFADDQNGN